MVTPIAPWDITRRPGGATARQSGSTPQMSHACASLALTLQLEGRWDDAIALAPPRRPSFSPARSNTSKLLAKAELEREHFAEAIDCYREIIKRDPDDAKAHSVLGLLLQEEGQLDLAADHLQMALAVGARTGHRERYPWESPRKDGRLRRRRGLLPGRHSTTMKEVPRAGATGHAAEGQAA